MAVKLDTSQVTLHALSVDGFHRMIGSGVFAPDDRVELLEGALVEMSPNGPAHAHAVMALTAYLSAALGPPEHWVRVQLPLTLADERSEPEPDLAVVDGERIARDSHPTTALLVIEVAVTSQRLDRTEKARLYARAGVPDYWVVDVPAGLIEVRRDPGPAGYASTAVIRAGDTVRPLVVPAPPLEVAALLA